MMRIIQLYKRFKNQYRIHKHYLSFWAILRISWIQSKNKKREVLNKMDTPIANLMVKSFCKGFERQAKKEEKEAETIVAAIDYAALKALCIRYDNKTGEYPEHKHEGAAVLTFFEELRDDRSKGIEGGKK